MKFFLPLTDDPAKAEYCWKASRLILEEAGFPTLPQRIQALAYWRDDEARYLQVGINEPDNGEIVLLIFRAANAPFFWVCTPTFGLLGQPPIAVPARRGTWAVEFSGKD